MNDQQRAAMRCALEALEEAHTVIEHRQDVRKREEAITALREALAQPQGEWVDLTDDDISDTYAIWWRQKHVFGSFTHAVIAKFKEKNTPPVVPQGEPVAWIDKGRLEGIKNGWQPVLAFKQLEDDVPLYTPTPSVEAAIATMRDALVHIREYWNRDQNETAMADALWHIIEVAEKSLTGDKNDKRRIA